MSIAVQPAPSTTNTAPITLNRFAYKGRVEGQMDGNVFKGNVGELPVWVFGRTAQALYALVGQHALVEGLLESRNGNTGRYFLQPRIFAGVPATPTGDVNLVYVSGTVDGVRRIKDGLSELTVEVPGTRYENGQRVNTSYVLPMESRNTMESDIGKQVTVIGKLVVRQGKYVNVQADHVALAGVSAAAGADAEFGITTETADVEEDLWS